MSIPIRYLPFSLSDRDSKRQIQMLKRSQKLYKNGKYYTRKNLPSFHSKPSKHIQKAIALYKVDSLHPTKKLEVLSGCSVNAMKQIMKKGKGAYYSSGSRPNQTPQSWAFARLASSLTGGKSSAVDFHILQSGCKHTKPAYKLAKQSLKKYKYGKAHTHHITM